MIIPLDSNGPTKLRQMLDPLKIVRGIRTLLPTNTKPGQVRKAAILNHTLHGAVHEEAIPAPIKQAVALEAVVQDLTVLVAVHAAGVQVLQLVDHLVEADLPVLDLGVVVEAQVEAVPDHRVVNKFNRIFYIS